MQTFTARPCDFLAIFLIYILYLQYSISSTPRSRVQENNFRQLQTKPWGITHFFFFITVMAEIRATGLKCLTSAFERECSTVVFGIYVLTFFSPSLFFLRQLSEENANLQVNVEKESNEKKRLSRTNEELLWRLQTGELSPRMSPSSSPIHRPSSGPGSPARPHSYHQ